MLHHVLIGILVHEALQWTEPTHSQQLHITGIAVAALLDVVAAVDQGTLVIAVTHHQVDQVAAMGLDVPVWLSVVCCGGGKRARGE